MTAVGRVRAAKAVTAARPAAPSSDEIALRAFLKWQERGGDELSNWIEAEQELHAERLGGARASSGRTGAGRAGSARIAAKPSTSRKRRRHASSPR